MFATDLYQYKTFLEPKKVACCCFLCLEGWEYCSRVLETSPGFYANTDSTTAIPIVLWQYREVIIGIRRSGVSTATPASNPWKDLFNKFITTIRLVYHNNKTLVFERSFISVIFDCNYEALNLSLHVVALLASVTMSWLHKTT